ncbi:hypothetical protein [Saccharothrix syringae]|uniref:Uncharacterized protein n=1 Tax=Saccharothrix syringae TaxID=103733 RepID=A0A5Q0H0B9_SACSY|nr:hypothetical protein [Saccharothrix syringae]QFZ19677.1 hypothetical protein EKG83_21585 [Saccharothrix syringae]
MRPPPGTTSTRGFPPSTSSVARRGPGQHVAGVVGGHHLADRRRVGHQGPRLLDGGVRFPRRVPSPRVVGVRGTPIDTAATNSGSRRHAVLPSPPLSVRPPGSVAGEP